MPTFFEPATSTGLITSTGLAVVIPSYISSVQLTAGAAAATLVITDGTSAGVVSVNITAATTTTTVYQLNVPVASNRGIYVTLTGTGATAVVHYLPGA